LDKKKVQVHFAGILIASTSLLFGKHNEKERRRRKKCTLTYTHVHTE